MSLIVTSYVRPPVPTTMYDWMAYLKADEGEANGPTGRGPTECEALRDLCEQLAELLAENMAEMARYAIAKAEGKQ